MKSDFLSTISHKLRTPIAIIRESVSLCLDEILGEINAKQRELLTVSLENTDRLTQLVTDLLDMSKIESGNMQLRRNNLNLSKLMQKMYEEYNAVSNDNGLDLAYELPESDILLYADHDKVRQIFENLLNNACRYTPSGGEVCFGAVDHKDFISCFVKDTGVGIAKENLTKLFSKFEQHGQSDGPGYQGTGLGLAIAKGVVEKHGGKIWAESDLGKETIFHFTLQRMPYPKILVVDDEECIIEVIREYLIQDGYRFIEASDGRSAIQMAINELPELILLDMRLPAMNGYEVVGRLKHDKRTQNIPLIIMSAHEIDELRLPNTNGHSVFPILHKPFDLHQLRMTVQESLMN